MKKSVLIFVVSVLFFGCSSEQKKAERIAEKFLEAYYISFDFDKCFELSSPSSAPKIKDKKTMIGFNPLAKEQPPTIAVVKTVIDESATMAQCSYTINGAVQSLALLKLSGHWLVDAVASDLDAVSVFGGGHGGFA
ncbi:MAG: hypothetical protein LBU04_07690, partial [Christensenellaceae bacterium]|nr:hypothetical protein [Christensenellaceae bacterium]